MTKETIRLLCFSGRPAPANRPLHRFLWDFRMAGAGIVLAVSPVCNAELPPPAYEAMARSSTEVLCIRVDDVSRLWLPWGDYIDVTGQVKQVVRSESDLKPGDMVSFSYKRKPFGSSNPGPSEPPVVNEETTVPVYLQPGEGSGELTIGAAGKSFAPIIESAWLSVCE